MIKIYEAKNDESESKITTQVKTKIILLQFILEMWKKGFVIENDTSGRNKWWKKCSCISDLSEKLSRFDGDGIGDIPGIISRLDYLKKLGIDAPALTGVPFATG